MVSDMDPRRIDSGFQFQLSDSLGMGTMPEISKIHAMLECGCFEKRGITECVAAEPDIELVE